MKKGIRRGDYKLIAIGLKCSPDYVKKVIRNERDSKSRLAKKILLAKKRLLTSRNILMNNITELADQE